MEHLFLKRSKINGTGLYTKKRLKPGDRVGIIEGEVEIVRKWTPALSKISPNWIGIGRYSWINTKKSPFRYINHSCDPNTYIVGKRTVVALKNIAADDEVTMDYSLTEADQGYTVPGGCHCGSKKCRKMIGPINSLTVPMFKKVQHLVPKNFKKIFLTELKKNNVGIFSY